MNAATIRQAKFTDQAQPKSADKSTKIGLTVSWSLDYSVRTKLWLLDLGSDYLGNSG